MDDQPPSDSTPAPAGPPLRLWPLGVIFGLAALAIGGAAAAGAWWDDAQSGTAWTIIFIAVPPTLLALAAWLLLFSRMAARPKWIIFGLGVAAVAVAARNIKIEHTGNLTPKITFGRGVVNVAIEKTVQHDGVDLLKTTPDDVPEFLGPGRRPMFPKASLDTDWKAHPPREVWRQPIGPGFGGFAVVGDFAVTQQQEGGNELVVCYEWRTGRPRWKHADEASFTSSLGGDGPRATPTINGGRVYSMGATGILNCLNGRDGSVLWRADTLKENLAKNLDWGVSCSPLVVGNLVVVSAGLRDTAVSEQQHKHYTLIAYDKLTGKPIWRGGTDDASFCSPALATIGGVRQIVIANAGTVTGHDIADGHVLWEFEIQRSMPTVSQAVPLDDQRVFHSKGYQAGCGVQKVTRDAAGKWTAETLWAEPRYLRTKFTNVIIVGDQAYGLDDGFLQCIDLKTPKQRWTTRRQSKVDYGHGQVILAGDVLLVQTEQGDVALVEATPDKFHELTRFSPLSGRTWNYPVLVGNYLLTRNDREAVCYELPKK